MEDEMAKKILEVINRLGQWEEKVAEKIASDHPTLQQTFMRLCMAYIKVQSKRTNQIDLRNQKTVELAKKIAQSLKEEDYYLPMV